MTCLKIQLAAIVVVLTAGVAVAGDWGVQTDQFGNQGGPVYQGAVSQVPFQQPTSPYQQPGKFGYGAGQLQKSYPAPWQNSSQYQVPSKTWQGGSQYQVPPKTWQSGSQYQVPSKTWQGGSQYQVPPKTWQSGSQYQVPPKTWQSGSQYQVPSKPWQYGSVQGY